MTGYAGRNKPAEGKIHDLWAKALVLEESPGQRLIIHFVWINPFIFKDQSDKHTDLLFTDICTGLNLYF